jgi:hypothetical protein
LVEVDTRSGVNPASQVGLTTEVVGAQRLGIGGRADAVFDQVIWRFGMRSGESQHAEAG